MFPRSIVAAGIPDMQQRLMALINTRCNSKVTFGIRQGVALEHMVKEANCGDLRYRACSESLGLLLYNCYRDGEGLYSVWLNWGWKPGAQAIPVPVGSLHDEPDKIVDKRQNEWTKKVQGVQLGSMPEDDEEAFISLRRFKAFKLGPGSKGSISLRVVGTPRDKAKVRMEGWLIIKHNDVVLRLKSHEDNKPSKRKKAYKDYPYNADEHGMLSCPAFFMRNKHSLEPVTGMKISTVSLSQTVKKPSKNASAEQKAKKIDLPLVFNECDGGDDGTNGVEYFALNVWTVLTLLRLLFPAMRDEHDLDMDTMPRVAVQAKDAKEATRVDPKATKSKKQKTQHQGE